MNHTFSYDESLSSSPPVPTTAQSFLLSDPPLVTEKLLLSPSDLQICSTGIMSGIIATASPWVSVLRIPHLFLAPRASDTLETETTGSCYCVISPHSPISRNAPRFGPKEDFLVWKEKRFDGWGCRGDLSFENDMCSRGRGSEMTVPLFLEGITKLNCPYPTKNCPNRKAFFICLLRSQ